MHHTILNEALEAATAAARAAGQIMRENLYRPKKINRSTPHDIKLALDVHCQTRIEGLLRRALPGIGMLGEEGVSGRVNADQRWVIDPLDGTVNYAYGIPHACVSIALQFTAKALRSPGAKLKNESHGLKSWNSPLVPPGRERGKPHSKGGIASNYETVLAVVYDPFQDELWTALHGEAARLNGNRIVVSGRHPLKECIVAVGFGKNNVTLEKMLPAFNRMARRARKVRIMGAAALGLAYVACGRLEAYTEYGLRLWDIAAGGLIVECAGGEFWQRPVAGRHCYHVLASNGLLGRRLRSID